MISVIIPCKSQSDLCPELLPAIKNQSLKPLETIVITDKICPLSPPQKRDFGAKKAKGRTLAFIDSDAYPSKNWLKNAAKQLKYPSLGAVCGPGLTPPTDNYFQRLSGLVWSSKLGAGPYTYRNRREHKRFVDDYPTFNLIVSKKDFLAVNGFDSQFWPGEDTKLCHDLVYKLRRKILYHPDILIFHHRRPVFIPHLKQISRYGFQRGRFVKLFPQTSKRFSYFLPLLILLTFPFTWPVYLLALLFTSLKHRSFLLAPSILLTHLTYALYFLKGLTTTKKTKP